MKKNVTKIIFSVGAMLTLLFSYTHCVHPESKGTKGSLRFQDNTVTNSGSNSGNNSAGNSGGNNSSGFNEKEVSINAFSQTVYPLTRNHCVACHAVSQQPLHASANATIAHDHIVDTAKVNFANVNNSRLVQRLGAELHYCWTPNGCAQNAAQMAAAITDWKERVDEERRRHEGSQPMPESTALRTTESSPLNQLLEEENEMDMGTFAINKASSSLRAPMVSGTEGGYDYFYAPVGSGTYTSNSDSRSGSVYFNFMTTLSDSYKLWARINAADNNSNSFFMRINGGFIYEWNIAPTNGFQWRELTHTTANLDVIIPLANTRTHLLEVRHREANTKISDIFFTNDPNFNPSENEYKSKVTLRYSLQSLTSVADSYFEIDLEEYDSYSYQFSNPRLITPNRPIAVRAVRLRVNGQLNPQNSTYTLIDRVVSPSSPVLLNRAMIVLKDEGSERDRFSFEFDMLEAQ